MILGTQSSTSSEAAVVTLVGCTWSGNSAYAGNDVYIYYSSPVIFSVSGCPEGYIGGEDHQLEVWGGGSTVYYSYTCLPPPSSAPSQLPTPKPTLHHKVPTPLPSTPR